jgi:hypothetical protein
LAIRAATGLPAAVFEVQRVPRVPGRLATVGSAEISVLPDEPVLLSYPVAFAMIIELPDRQELIAQPDAVSHWRPSVRC